MRRRNSDAGSGLGSRGRPRRRPEGEPRVAVRTTGCDIRLHGRQGRQGTRHLGSERGINTPQVP